MSRRQVLAAVAFLTTAALDTAQAKGLSGRSVGVNILAAKVNVKGDWHGVSPETILHVCTYIRDVCFSGLSLVGEAQPASIQIENHLEGPPSIWLHDDQPTAAQIIVDTGTATWAQLAYQFGHELGHVLANSWKRNSVPAHPSQWIEETLAESFSIANLGQLARMWESQPPFEGDSAYGKSIMDYRNAILIELEGKSAPLAGLPGWLANQKGNLATYFDGTTKLNAGLVRLLVDRFDADRSLMSEMAAMNLWPERSAVESSLYLDRWSDACQKIGLEAILPKLIKSLLFEL